MGRHERRAAILIGALVLAGCTSSTARPPSAQSPAPWAPTTVPGDGFPTAGAKGYVLAPDLAAVGIPPPPVVDPARVYALADLIDLAQSSNPVTRAAWHEARRAAFAVGMVESAYLPLITASALGGYQDRSGRDAAGGLSLRGEESGQGIVSILSLRWLLFDFGQRDAATEAARQGAIAADIAFTATHQQVIHGVSLAYYAHAAARARSATAIRALANAHAIEAAAQDRYGRGLGTVIEVAQARQLTAQARLALVQAEGALQDAYFALLTAMGISPFAKIEIAEVSNRDLSPATARTAEAIVAQAVARRPDVQAAYAAEKASISTVAAARAEFLPKFFLSAQASYGSGSLDVSDTSPSAPQAPTLHLDGHHFGWGIVAGAAVPLFDGGMRRAALARTSAEAESAGARSARVKLEAVREIIQADNALRAAVAAHEAAGNLAAAARTTFEATLAAYRSGAGTITDTILAENQLLLAENAASDARSIALSAAASLALAAGLLGSAPE